MININEVLEKLKDIISIEKGDRKLFNKDISETLGIKYDNFRKQKARGSIPYPEIMNFLAKRNISINWFFFNQLPESLLETTSNYILLRYQKSTYSSSGAGAINYKLDTHSIVIDKQLLDYIKANYSYTEIINNIGDSMEPDISDNSLIFIDKSDTTLNTKGIYIIDTPEGLHTKRIITKDNKQYMSSINTIYNDVELNEYEVIGRVKGVLTKL